MATGQLWASNVSFLNDRRELKHGLEASLEAVNILAGGDRASLWNKALIAAAKSLKEDELPNTYAVCFCGNADILSQWRGYGGGTHPSPLLPARRQVVDGVDDLVELVDGGGELGDVAVVIDQAQDEVVLADVDGEISELFHRVPRKWGVGGT